MGRSRWHGTCAHATDPGDRSRAIARSAGYTASAGLLSTRPTRTIVAVDTARLTPSHMVVGGEALAREESGRVVFVSGALPGETVEVTFRSVSKDFARAEVTAVLDPSPDRVEPPCAAWHRGCGGCDWQHVAPSAQLRLKTEIVREALCRTGRVEDPTVTAGGVVAPWHYRTTVRLGGLGDGRVGFRSRRSHDLVAVDECPVADPRINDLLISHAIDGRGAMHNDVTVRVGTSGGPVVTNHLAGASPDQTDGVVYEEVCGHRFRVSPASFFQSSSQAAELLVAAVERVCASIDMASSCVVDAYGGVGLFAATAAAEAGHVILVESSPSACADARFNLAGRRASIVESRFERWQPLTAGLVIADPSRSGLDTGGVAACAATGAEVVVLVSCDAGSLGRDTRLLRGYGYMHAGTEVIDVFPNTSHIEAVSRFVVTSSRTELSGRA
jgi:23S rRNA (uracil1939-C5)-methyltransferase